MPLVIVVGTATRIIVKYYGAGTLTVTRPQQAASARKVDASYSGKFWKNNDGIQCQRTFPEWIERVIIHARDETSPEARKIAADRARRIQNEADDSFEEIPLDFEGPSNQRKRVRTPRAADYAILGFMARLYVRRTLCIMQRGEKKRKKLGEERISSFLYV